MKQGMSNVDVAALVAELRPILVGARLEKAYQPERDVVLLRLRRKGLGRLDMLYQLGKFMTITRRPPENPDKPSMVAQIYRSTLSNGRITALDQVGFDRILRMRVERGDGIYHIVFEIFGDGNMLLLDDSDTIILPMRGGDYGVRRLRKGELYQPPPGDAQPLTMDAAALKDAGTRAKHDLVRMLAVELGMGPQWAEELCLRAGIAKGSAPSDMDDAAWTALHEATQALAEDIARNDLAPVVAYKNEEAVDAVPFPLQVLEKKGCVFEEAPTFRQALDRFFVGAEGDEEADDDPRRVRFNEAKGKLERQVAQVEGAMSKFDKQEDLSKRRGDALYAAFQEVQQILDGLTAARKTRSWHDIAKTLDEGRAAGNPQAQMIRELRPDTARATLALQDGEGTPLDVEIDVRATVQDNADTHYSAAKKARSRREGATKALDDARRKLAELEKKGLDGFGAAPKKKEAKRHFWFESYRWTLTPNGLLAVGGRSAAQNDTVVKKYLRDGDRYVHAAIHGAPSVVVRDVNDNVEPQEEDLRIACQFAACSSRAWRQFGAASAYWVTPQQVNKTPRSGEFVPKGAWIIHGKRNTIDDLPMAWLVARVGFTQGGKPLPPDAEAPIEKLVGGPPDGLEPFARQSWKILPGDTDPNLAAPQLAELSGFSVEEAQAVLPPGPVQVPT